MENNMNINNNLLKEYVTQLVESQNDLLAKLGIENIKNEKSDLDKYFDDIIDAVRKSKIQAINYLKEKEKNNEQLEDNNQFKQKYEELKNEYDKLNDKNKELNDKNKELNDKNKELNTENEELKRKIKCGEEYKTLAEKAHLFTEHLKDYSALFEIVLKCESLSDFCKKRNLSSNISSQLIFYKNFNLNYVKNIIESMKIYKREHQVALTDNELKMIKSINSLIKKQNINIDYDIISLPDNVSEENVGHLKTRYEQGKMENVSGGLAPTVVNAILTPYVKIKDESIKALVIGEIGVE